MWAVEAVTRAHCGDRFDMITHCGPARPTAQYARRGDDGGSGKSIRTHCSTNFHWNGMCRKAPAATLESIAPFERRSDLQAELDNNGQTHRRGQKTIPLLH